MPGVVGSTPEAGEYDNLIVKARGRGERERMEINVRISFFSYSFSNNSRLYQITKIKSCGDQMIDTFRCLANKETRDFCSLQTVFID